MFSQPKNDSVAAPSLAEFQPLYAQVKNLLNIGRAGDLTIQ